MEYLAEKEKLESLDEELASLKDVKAKEDSLSESEVQNTVIGEAKTDIESIDKPTNETAEQNNEITTEQNEVISEAQTEESTVKEQNIADLSQTTEVLNTTDTPVSQPDENINVVQVSLNNEIITNDEVSTIWF